eukprot:TRINITY_DN5245_c0_g1_i1.p1 TRINITY_DN5245_c0_g1~~TRINITY_DN5245_c0_g1_i1.p1  ORF type:complete len:573 (+),score=146.81 TRINITY_DN5245_c0_g1_i1:131-1849(+)
MRRPSRSVLLHVNGLRDQSHWIRDELRLLNLSCSREGSVFGESLLSDEQQPTYSLRFFPRPGPKESILAQAKEEGHVLLEDVSSRQTLARFRAHSNAIFDLCWSPCGDQIATGSGDTSLSLWDVASLSHLHSLKGGHDRAVKCLQFSPKASSLLASGSRDNSVLLWDPRSRDPIVNRIKSAHCSRENRPCSVTAIQFLQNEHLLASGGEMDDTLKIWDLRKNYSLYKRDPLPSYTLPHPQGSRGITSLSMDVSNTLFVSCMDGKIYRFSLTSFDETPLNVYSGHKVASFYVRLSLSPDGDYLSSGSSDGSAYIWRVNPASSMHQGRETPFLCKLQGHSSEVTCVDWAKGGCTLVTCSDDMDHCVWRPDRREYKGEEAFGFTVPNTLAPLTPTRLTSCIPNTVHTPPPHFTPSSLRKRAHRGGCTPGSASSRKRRLTPSILNFLTKSGSKQGDIENVSPKRSLRPATEPPSKSIRSKLFDEPTPTPNSPPSQPLKFDAYPCSPTKMRILTNQDLESPKRLQFSPLKSFSPTANLPNYVMDPKTPTSSTKKRGRPVDWLTNLSNQKKSKAAKKL